MSEQELLQLQQEWREEVRDNFRDLKEMLGDMEKRVRDLEDTKTKAVGAVAAVQLLGAGALWAINQFSGK